MSTITRRPRGKKRERLKVVMSYFFLFFIFFWRSKAVMSMSVKNDKGSMARVL